MFAFLALFGDGEVVEVPLSEVDFSNSLFKSSSRSRARLLSYADLTKFDKKKYNDAYHGH